MKVVVNIKLLFEWLAHKDGVRSARAVRATAYNATILLVIICQSYDVTTSETILPSYYLPLVSQVPCITAPLIQLAIGIFRNIEMRCYAMRGGDTVQCYAL